MPALRGVTDYAAKKGNQSLSAEKTEAGDSPKETAKERTKEPSKEPAAKETKEKKSAKK